MEEHVSLIQTTTVFVSADLFFSSTLCQRTDVRVAKFALLVQWSGQTFACIVLMVRNIASWKFLGLSSLV